MGMFKQSMKIPSMNDLQGIQNAARNAENSISKNLGEYFGKLDEQNSAIVDSQNDIIKALVTVYELNVSIAKKIGAEIPEPKTNMKIE